MREQEFQELLLSMLTVETGTFDDDLEVEAQGPLLQAVSTFKEAGVIAHEWGLVVASGDGSEFRITIERTG
jgi:hypothetical protein